MFNYGGRALNDLGGILLTEVNQTPNTIILELRSETMGINFHGQKGNNPDHQLRSLIITKWERRWRFTNNQEVGLEAAILERVRNSSLVKWFCADNVAGLKRTAEAVAATRDSGARNWSAGVLLGRGASCMR